MPTNSAQRSGKNLKLAIGVLGLITLILFVGWTIKIIQNIAQPFGLKGVDKTYTWDGSANINFIFKGGDYSLVQFDPNELKVKIVKLPPQVYLNVPGGYGFWQLRSVYSLGESENPPNGLRVLKKSIGNFFGLPIDGLLEVASKDKSIDAKNLLMDVKNNPLGLFIFLKDIKTDLNLAELLHLSLALKQVRFDKIDEFDLLTLGLLENKLAVDGGIELIADTQKIDGFVLNNLIDNKLANEAKEVVIFNTTQTQGLGQKAGQLISHLGVNVTQISSISDQALEKSLVISREKEKSLLLKRLLDIFGLECKDSKDCAIIDHPTVKSSRGQIIVLLGKDFDQ